MTAITPWRNDAFWRMSREVDREDLTFGSATVEGKSEASG